MGVPTNERSGRFVLVFFGGGRKNRGRKRVMLGVRKMRRRERFRKGCLSKNTSCLHEHHEHIAIEIEIDSENTHNEYIYIYCDIFNVEFP